VGRVRLAPCGRRLPCSRRVTAPHSPSLPTPGTLTRGFEIRAGVTALIKDAEGVS
jgi:hypothetical protein